MNSCNRCNNKIVDKQFVICEICVTYFHLRCLGFGVSEFKLMSERDGICYICASCRNVQGERILYKELKNQCDLMQEYILKIDQTLQQQKVPFNTIELEVKNIKETLQPGLDEIKKSSRITQKLVKDTQIEMKSAATGGVNDNRETFSSVVKSVCVIKPKDDTQAREVTKKTVMERIDPIDVKVSGMRNVRGGGVAILCDTPESLRAVKTVAEEKMGETYEITTPKPLLPRVKISGLLEKYEPDDIKSKILAQNELPIRSSEDFSIVAVRETKRGIYFDAFMETAPHIYKLIMKTGLLKVGWSICRVTDAMDVRRCARCCSYEHLVKNCVSTLACLKCGGAGHYAKDCKSDRVACVNCLRANRKFGLKIDPNHCANNQNCPAFLRANKSARDRISF